MTFIIKRSERRKNPVNRGFYKKLISTIIFISFLLVFSFQNIKLAYNPLREFLQKGDLNYANISELVKSAEGIINDNVYEKYKFIDGYSYLQNLMSKNEEANFEVVKDTDGILHYTFFATKPNPVDELVTEVKKFNDGIEDKNKKLMYLMTPDKFIKGHTKFETGIPYSYANETADNLLEGLAKDGINSIDLRENLDKSGIPSNELFYKTDHHWKTETVFYEYCQLIDMFKENYGLDLDPNKFYTNKENYNFIKYNNSYIGSMGRKAGMYYTGVDDFTIIYPKFKTSYTFYTRTGEIEDNLQGRFEDALISTYPLNLKGDSYGLEADKYFSYLYGNWGVVHIHNKDKVNGPKLLFIKDSLAVPLAAFLSTVCSDVYLLDPRYYKEDMLKFANETDLDYIFISFYPQNLTKEFFSFGKKDEK